MTTLNVLYENEKQLLDFIETNNIDIQKACFVRIHISVEFSEVCTQIARTVKSALPNAIVSGVSASGVIYNGQILQEGILVSFLQFDNAEIVNKTMNVSDEADEEIAEQIALDGNLFGKAVAFVFFAGNNWPSNKLLNAILEKMPETILFGGIAGHLTAGGQVQSYIFDDISVIERGVSITYISTKYVLPYANVVIGHEPVSKPYKFTKVNNLIVEEIENEHASTWFANKLNLGGFLTDEGDGEAFSDALLLHPLVLQNDEGASRFVQYDVNTKNLMFYTVCLDDTYTFRVGYLSPLKSADEWQSICYDLKNTPAESMFWYSCVFRKDKLKSLSTWEVKHFVNAELCGAFLFGEIGTRNGKSNFFEGSCSLLTLAENEQYIEPDLSFYDSLKTLGQRSEDILNKLSSTYSGMNEKGDNELIDGVALHEKMLKTKMLPANKLGLESATEFFVDKATAQYKQICFINVREKTHSEENVATSVDLLGDVLEKSLNYLNSEHAQLEPVFYNYNINSLFFAVKNSVSNSNFIDATHDLFSNLKTIYSEEKYERVHLHLVATLTGTNVNTLHDEVNKHAENSKRFKLSVHNDNDGNENELTNEFKKVTSIKYALKENKVLPYFQGIYDNHKNRFYCYEALMRLQDRNGKILMPGQFLDIAKKYNLYDDLSLRMVLNVLDLFGEREEIITLNISALDVLNSNFCDKLFSKLDSMTNKAHFIFEIVETERFENYDDLRSFISSLKRYNIEVAVDDFGAGYSNFIEIGNLQIDYIKINGSLTSLLGTDTSYDQILQSIYYLSEKMNVELIAECVETASMQKRIVNSGVRYSQGYFFSKPMSIEELNIVSRDNPKDDVVIEEDNNSPYSFLNNKNATKRSELMLYWGGIIVAILTMLSIFTFASYNQSSVEDMSDAFLMEIATGMTDKIAVVMENSSSLLLSIEASISIYSQNEEEIYDSFSRFGTSRHFDEMYLSYGDGKLISTRGETLNIDEASVLNVADRGEVEIFSPMADAITGEEFFLIGTPIYSGTEKVAEIFGLFYLDGFDELLDLKSFGGEAFFHLCEVEGTPLILSGDSDNLFKDGDMYSFIGTLDIKNGHTAESLKQDMENGSAEILKYVAGGEERTAVMITVPNTPWCVVSIVLSDVTTGMVENINTGTFVFSIILVLIFASYFVVTQLLARRIRKDLIKSLETSKFLTNSLQQSISTDPLTRTFSRATAKEKISEIISSSRNIDYLNAMLIIDVDNFKQINDTYGHQTGDIYLQELVSAIKKGLRAGDIIGRLGGDEFVLLLADIKSQEITVNVVERIFNNIKNISLHGVSLDNIGVSAGIVFVPNNGKDYEELALKADKALYIAKNAGKDRYHIYNDNF